MKTQRLEAFSDGVIAIIITIMVLELRVPQGEDFEALKPVLPVFLSYVMSFAYLAIYWNNHHHMLHVTERASGAILWANMHLLFWLSLVPFVTGWMGQNGFASTQAACYGFVLLMAAIAYFTLQQTIIRHQGHHSSLKRFIGRDYKGKGSVLLYLAALPLSFINQWLAISIYVLVAVMWLVPDRRIERGVQ